MANETMTLPDPLNGQFIIQCSNTSINEIQPFIYNLQKTPKSGLHNPLKNPKR